MRKLTLPPGIQARDGKLEYRFQVRGKRYYRPTGLEATRRNVSVVNALREQHRNQVLSGRPVVNEKVLFNEAAEKFLGAAAEEHRAKPATFKRHRTSMTSLSRFFSDTPVAGITAGRIEDFIEWRRKCEIAEVTIRHDLATLGKFFGYAQRHEWTDGNPVKAVKKPSDRDSRNEFVLSSAQEGAYFSAAAMHVTLHDVGRLMILQGLRPMEALCLRQSDVDLAKQELIVTDSKTRSGIRRLALTQESAVLLGRRMDGKDWIFPSRRKVWHRRREEFYWVPVTRAHMTYHGIVKAHNAACERSGVEFDLYSLRHTFATRFYRQTKDIEALRRVLGHADLKTLLRYIHIDDNDVREAMAKFESSLDYRSEVVN